MKKVLKKMVGLLMATIMIGSMLVGSVSAAAEEYQHVRFGTFETRERKVREGRNPSTGETISIPACISPAFKAGKAVKDAVAK